MKTLEELEKEGRKLDRKLKKNRKEMEEIEDLNEIQEYVYEENFEFNEKFHYRVLKKIYKLMTKEQKSEIEKLLLKQFIEWIVQYENINFKIERVTNV